MTDPHIQLMAEAKASWIYPIYVPSYKRAGTASLLNLLAGAPKAVKKKVFVQVRKNEAKAYREAYPWATIITHEAPFGVGPARIACFLDADERGFTRIAMLDDDVNKIGILESRGLDSNGKPSSGRYSRNNTDWSQVGFTLRALGVGCRMADATFEMEPDTSIGSARSGYFSSSVDVAVSSTIGLRGFPCCAFFIDLERFDLRELDEEFHYHGEDLAFFLDALDQGWKSFILDVITYEDNQAIPSVVPLGERNEIDRTPNLVTAQRVYPEIAEFLRVTNRNKETGAIKRLGVNWNQWHKTHGTEPVHLRTSEIVKYIKEN